MTIAFIHSSSTIQEVDKTVPVFHGRTMENQLPIQIVTGLIAFYAALSFKWPVLGFLFRFKRGFQGLFGISDEANATIGLTITRIVGLICLLVFIASFFVDLT